MGNKTKTKIKIITFRLNLLNSSKYKNLSNYLIIKIFEILFFYNIKNKGRGKRLRKKFKLILR
jgi:hypothetical protein